jgi:hypothetical protein
MLCSLAVFISLPADPGIKRRLPIFLRFPFFATLEVLKCALSHRALGHFFALKSSCLNFDIH